MSLQTSQKSRAIYISNPAQKNLLVGGITENIVLTFVLALILGLPVSVVLGGFGGTFLHSLFTLFYFGLVDPSTPYGANPPAAPTPTPTQP